MSFVLGKDAVVLRKGWKSPEESSESGVRIPSRSSLGMIFHCVAITSVQRARKRESVVEMLPVTERRLVEESTDRTPVQDPYPK